MPLATLRPTQGQSLHQHAMGDTALAFFGRIPWIDRQGVWRAWRRQSNDVNDDGDDGDSDGSDADDRDGGDNGNINEGDVDGDGGGDNDYDNDDVNDNDDDDDNDDGTTTMRWQRQQWNDNDAMTTMWWRWARERRATHPRQQSTYVDSLGRSWPERGTILGDRRTETGRTGSYWVEITSSPLDQFQINFLHTPEWQTHGILFCMCPGSKAALSAPWWACLMTVKKRNEKCQSVSLLGGGFRPT